MTDDPTQRDLDDVEALAERMVAAATAAEVAEPAPVAEPLPTVSATLGRVVDPGSLVIGIWFVLAGLVAAVLGADALEDLPPIVIPLSFAVTGLALLLPKRSSRPRRQRDW